MTTHERGLNTTYRELIETAFQADVVAVEPDRRRGAERLDLVRAASQPPAARQRIHDDRIQLLRCISGCRCSSTR